MAAHPYHGEHRASLHISPVLVISTLFNSAFLPDVSWSLTAAPAQVSRWSVIWSMIFTFLGPFVCFEKSFFRFITHLLISSKREDPPSIRQKKMVLHVQESSCPGLLRERLVSQLRHLLHSACLFHCFPLSEENLPLF